SGLRLGGRGRPGSQPARRLARLQAWAATAAAGREAARGPVARRDGSAGARDLHHGEAVARAVPGPPGAVAVRRDGCAPPPRAPAARAVVRGPGEQPCGPPRWRGASGITHAGRPGGRRTITISTTVRRGILQLARRLHRG